MKFIHLVADAFRVHVPKWSASPTSGAGAGAHGGRLNRIGVDALYVSLTPEIALIEYRQLDALVPPGAIVSYKLDVAHIVDFTGGYDASWEPIWMDIYCDWRKLHFCDGIEPPSWAIGELVRAAGGQGVLFRSSLADGINVVLYTDALRPGEIAVYDPGKTLPKNQDSWT